MNESCHVYGCHTHERVKLLTQMSHVTHMNESCHTYEWAVSHTWTAHSWVSFTHMNGSCHTVSVTNYRARYDGSCLYVTSTNHHMGSIWWFVLICHEHEPSYRALTVSALSSSIWWLVLVTYERFTSNIWKDHFHRYEWVMSHIWMSQVPHMNPIRTSELSHTYEWVMSHSSWSAWYAGSCSCHMSDSRHTYECIMSHIWMYHVTHMNESCHTWTSHVTHVNVTHGRVQWFTSHMTRHQVFDLWHISHHTYE